MLQLLNCYCCEGLILIVSKSLQKSFLTSFNWWTCRQKFPIYVIDFRAFKKDLNKVHCCFNIFNVCRLFDLYFVISFHFNTDLIYFNQLTIDANANNKTHILKKVLPSGFSNACCTMFISMTYQRCLGVCNLMQVMKYNIYNKEMSMDVIMKWL